MKTDIVAKFEVILKSKLKLQIIIHGMTIFYVSYR
jgi:hypothetical protein